MSGWLICVTFSVTFHSEKALQSLKQNAVHFLAFIFPTNPDSNHKYRLI